MVSIPVWWQPDIPTWVALVLGALSLVVGLTGMVTALMVATRRPKLKTDRVWFEPDTLERGFRRWHVSVLNEPTSGLSRWAARETAVDAEGTIEFFRDGRALEGEIIHGIWTERPRPLRDELVVEARRATLIAGRPWNMPIALKMKGQVIAHQFDHKNYRQTGEFEGVPGRSLPEGDYAVRLTIHEGPRRWPFWFRLRNRTDEIGVFKLDGPYKQNPLKRGMDFPLTSIP